MAAATALACSLAAAGCGRPDSPAAVRKPAPPKVAGVTLVDADRISARPAHTAASDCRSAARQVGYAIACPGLLPKDSVPTAAGPACPLRYQGVFVHPACVGGRKLAFMSVEWPTAARAGHLVVVTTSTRLPPLAAITAPVPPALYDRVEPLGPARIAGRRALWLRVPQGTASSAFAGHLVLYWTTRRHSYVVGFHGFDAGARRLDLALVRSIQLVDG